LGILGLRLDVGFGALVPEALRPAGALPMNLDILGNPPQNIGLAAMRPSSSPRLRRCVR
jgi:hypothetical protein